LITRKILFFLSIISILIVTPFSTGYSEIRTDSSWFPKKSIRFGYTYVYRDTIPDTLSYIAYDLVFPDHPYAESMLYENIRAEGHPYWARVEIPEEKLAPYITERIGDTVLIITPSGKFRAVIDEFLYYNGLKGQLKPAGQISQLPDHFMILKDTLISYDGPIIAFQEYDAYNPPYKSLTEEIFNENIRLGTAELGHRVDKKEHSEFAQRKDIPRDTNPVYPFYSTTIKAFGPRQDNTPDYLFITFRGFWGETERQWGSIHKLVCEKGRWSSIPLKTPGFGWQIHKFLLAFDLDNDGNLEYLTDVGARFGIFTIIDNQLYLLHYGRYWGT
jgi:hypothetical protein